MPENRRILPRRNLGAGESWGRDIEKWLRDTDADVVQVSQSLNNSQRATSGQLAVMSRQLDRIVTQQEDLRNRASYIDSPANLSITNNATTNPPSVTRTFTLPAPEADRAAIIGFSATLTNSGGTGTPVRAFVDLSYGGSVRARGDYQVPQTLSTPSGWIEQVNFFSFITVPSGSGPSFSVRLYRLGFTSTSTTLTMSNMSAFIQYGDKV